MALQRIDSSKLTAIADAIRGQLGTTETMTPDEMPGMIRDIGIGVIPSYWRSYLNTKATEINTALAAASGEKSAFLWYTDAHWTTNYYHSPMMLKYLSKHTGMKKTFFGGDITNATSGEIAILEEWQRQVGGVPNHHSVLGNHDNQVTELPTPGERGDFFLGAERTGDVVFGTDATYGKTHYYIDNHIEKTRYICLNTGIMWTYKADTAFCVEALTSTPDGWHIVIIGHIWLNYHSSDWSVDATPPDYTQTLLDLFDAYNTRKSGTTTMNSVAYNFTAATGKVEFILGGHIHQDYDFATAKGIPVILTECDSYQERDNATNATKGTTTESCVYAIVADYTAKVVKVINVGRGESRTIPIPDVVMYTNRLAEATDASGNVYNGIGYKPSTRLSVSSGTFEERTEAGWCTTGFIEATAGDVVRLKNCTFTVSNPAGGSHRGCICGADANYGYITSSQTMVTQFSSATGCNPVFDASGVNVIQFTVPTYIKSKYIRIVAQEFTADSIITVNEEIS